MTTTPESRLLELYDRVAEAPDAIERLRKFVLDLAVRGKLVEQNPEDEPAEELLERIAAEKTRLVKAGEIRKPRDLANGNEIEEPFEIPSTWRWCRLDTVGAIIGGGTPAAADAENFAEPGEGIPWLTPADLGGYRDLYIERGKRDLTGKGLKSSSATMMPAGTVLFTSRAPIGYVAIAANPISTNQGFKSIVPYSADCSRFIAVAMRTFAPEIDAKAPGTTFKEVSGKIVAGVPFPLPPLPEQHRIVAKVDELMTLLDRLETTRTQRETTHDRLTTASLTRLTAPDSAENDFLGHARFALDNLDQLTSRPDQTKVLRQTILDLAVRGKLVEQDPAEEPAEALLNQISEEKTTLLKAGEIKKPKPLARINANELPFKLPSGWAWARLDALIDLISGQHLQPPEYSEDPIVGLPYITGPSDFGTNGLEIRRYALVRKAVARRGQLLLTVKGSGVGKATICDLDEVAISRQLMALTAIAWNPDFLELMADRLATKLQSEARSLIPGISREDVTSFVVALPPLAEQHRIVEKLDTLMKMCAKLEVAKTMANTTRARLLEVLLHDSLAQDAHNGEAT